MRFLARVFDMIVSNALFLICCVPVVTAGAAIAALNKADPGHCPGPGLRDHPPVFQGRSGKNFKQATAAFLVLAVDLSELGRATPSLS